MLEGEGRQEEEKEARREALTLKQRVVECEAAREAALQEVRLGEVRLCAPSFEQVSQLDTEVCVCVLPGGGSVSSSATWS